MDTHIPFLSLVPNLTVCQEKDKSKKLNKKKARGKKKNNFFKSLMKTIKNKYINQEEQF